MYLFAVGEKGVELARKVTDLDSKIRDTNTSIDKSAQEIDRAIKSDLSVESFVGLRAISGVEKQISKKKTELETAMKASAIKIEESLGKNKSP